MVFSTLVLKLMHENCCSILVSQVGLHNSLIDSLCSLYFVVTCTTWLRIGQPILSKRYLHSFLFLLLQPICRILNRSTTLHAGTWIKMKKHYNGSTVTDFIVRLTVHCTLSDVAEISDSGLERSRGLDAESDFHTDRQSSQGMYVSF